MQGTNRLVIINFSFQSSSTKIVRISTYNAATTKENKKDNVHEQRE